jgi:hypothetical protein
LIKQLKPEFKNLAMEQILASARVGLSAESDPATPQEWKVTAEVLEVGKSGADVKLELQGEGAVGDVEKHLGRSGTATWDVTVKDTATAVVRRLDTKGCSRVLLSNPEQEVWKTWAVIDGVKCLEADMKLGRSGNSLTFLAPSVMRCSGVVSGNHFSCDWKSDPAGESLKCSSEIDFSPDGKSFEGVYKGVQTVSGEGGRIVSEQPYVWDWKGERIY